MSNDSLAEKKKRLIAEVENLRIKKNSKRRTNEIIYYILVVAGIAFSAAAAVAGFSNIAHMAGVMAVIAATLVSVESAFKFGEKRGFFRIIANEYRNLETTLKYKVDSEQKFQLIVDKFQIVNARAAKTVPRGKGMQATKVLYEELDRKGILLVPEITSTGLEGAG